MADHAPTPSSDPALNQLMEERRAFWSSFTGATKFGVIAVAVIVIGLYAFFG